MKKNLEVVVGIDFDKQDVVTVAVANIEAMIRKEVRVSKTRRDELNEEITDTNNAIKLSGEKSVPKAMTQKFTQIEKALKFAGLVKTIGARIRFDFSGSTNDYQLHITEKDKSGEFTRQSISIMYKSTGLTSVQKSLVEKVKKMEKERAGVINYGVEWKSKLSDMSAVERQMRAKVVEAQLNKTTEGKALVELLTKNYKETIKLLEM